MWKTMVLPIISNLCPSKACTYMNKNSRYETQKRAIIVTSTLHRNCNGVKYITSYLQEQNIFHGLRKYKCAISAAMPSPSIPYLRRAEIHVFNTLLFIWKELRQKWDSRRIIFSWERTYFSWYHTTKEYCHIATFVSFR